MVYLYKGGYMADVILLNMLNVSGVLGEVPVAFDSNQASTRIIDGLSATKSADKAVWVNGALLYTITVTNNTEEDLAGGEFTDNLDTTLVTFDTNFGVKIDGTGTEEFTYQDGLLTVTLPALIEAGTSVVVTFQVLRV